MENSIKLLHEYDDILHLYIEYYKRDNLRLSQSTFRRNYFERILIILKSILRNIFVKTEWKSISKVTNKKWLFSLTLNNYRATQFLKEHYNDCVNVTIYNEFFKKGGNGIYENFNTFNYYPLWNAYLWLTSYFKILLTAKGVNRKFYLKYPNLFFFAYVSSVISKRLIEDGKPRVIFFSNDINMQSRSLNIEARKKNIPTVYIQHASISDYFPPLNFDLALLEGEFSKNVYKVKNDTEVKLIGQPKFEQYKKNRKVVKSVKCIGVGFNTIDDINVVHALVKFLKNNDFTVTVRPHPRESRKEFLSWDVDYFSTIDESPFEFLNKIDLLIAADTSLHLEATLMNIPSLYYNLNNNMQVDYYKYVENKVVDYADEFEEILNQIDHLNNQDNSNIFNRAQYYCQNTSDKFNSIDETVKAVNALLNK